VTLRARLILAFAGTAALVAAAGAFVAYRRTVDLMARRMREEEPLQRDRVRFGVRRASDQIERSLRQIQAVLMPDPAFPRGLAAPEPRDRVARMMVAGGLDALFVLDREGRVLAAGHWPEAFDLAHRELLGLPLAQPAGLIVEQAVAEAELIEVRGFPALVVRHAFVYDGLDYHLIGGRRLDDAGLLALLRPSPELPVRFRRPAEIALEGPPRPHGPYQVLRESLPGVSGRPFGVFEVERSLAGAAAERRALARDFILLGLAATLGSSLLGAGLAAGLTRSLSRLAHEVRSLGGAAEPVAGDETVTLRRAIEALQASLSEQQRRRALAERAAAWRQVAQRVAHEVKNPLSPIRLTVENLERLRRDRPEEFAEAFRRGSAAILEEVEQLRRIVDEFSRFARLPAPRPERTKIAELAARVVGGFAGERVHVDSEFRYPEVRLLVDPGLLTQALVNLALNAVDALQARPESGGTIRLRDRLEADRKIYWIELIDDGVGMDAETLRAAGNAGFSTKPGGSGLGLAIAKRIIEEHGGELCWSSTPGAGTRVSIGLPDPEIE
jgi:signal transduction histidine kinase